jgi:hypothetical protein
MSTIIPEQDLVLTHPSRCASPDAMSEYKASTYGDRIADLYDSWPGIPDDVAACVEFLAPLASRGPALELGIGTGRIALPLVARGIEVHGIDSSRKMIAKLRAKKGGQRIHTTLGDFAEVPVDGTYPLVFVVFNTFFALLSQEAQVQCFENVASHLSSGGVFVLQCFVPDVARFDRGQRTDTMFVDAERVRIEGTRYDQATQVVQSLHILIEHQRVATYPVQLRFAWPSELDLMARLAGLRLRERWSGWGRTPFTSASGQHISVFEKPARRSVRKSRLRGLRP